MTDLPLIVENLPFRYRDWKGAAINNISFSANKGDLVLLAGASGCGKTTLIRCINGLIPIRTWETSGSRLILSVGRMMDKYNKKSHSAERDFLLVVPD